MEQSIELNKFQAVCWEYFTCFYFVTEGLREFSKKIVIEEAVNPKNPNPTLWIGLGERKNGKALSKIKALDAKKYAEKDGRFSDDIAKALIVLIYSEWDELYRGKVAGEFKVEGKCVECDLMGDLRYVRHWIVHNKSIIDKKVDKIQTLDWDLVRGEKFIVTGSMFVKLMQKLNNMQLRIQVPD